MVRGKLLRWEDDDKKYVHDSAQSKAREKTKQKLNLELRKCLDHEQQYINQRKFVTNILDTVISQTTCLVYLDFVGHYYPGKSREDNNSKLNQLCFVFQFLDEDELVTSRYVSVLGEDPSDADFVIRAWEFLMLPASGLPWLQQMQEIYVARDNGAHLRNAQVVLFESSFQRKFRKQLHVRALASYHAYNRCDALGSVCKKIIRQAHCSEEGCEISPGGYQKVLNDNLNPKEYAWFTLDTIRARGPPDERKARKKPRSEIKWGHSGIARCTHIDYGRRNLDGSLSDEPGFVKGKIHSEQSQYLFFWDLNHPNVKLCQRCSCQTERPVRHEAKCLKQDVHESERKYWEEMPVDPYPNYEVDLMFDNLDEKKLFDEYQHLNLLAMDAIMIGDPSLSGSAVSATAPPPPPPPPPRPPPPPPPITSTPPPPITSTPTSTSAPVPPILNALPVSQSPSSPLPPLPPLVSPSMIPTSVAVGPAPVKEKDKIVDLMVMTAISARVLL